MTSHRPDPQQPTARPTEPAEQPSPDQPAQGGSPRTERAQVFEPARVRALAHPLRMDLLDHLGEVGEATATECAERLGQTVANCSFHLRTLARAGFIEPAGTRGRERPWRPATRQRTIVADPDSPASARAVQELAEIAVRRQSDRYIDHLRRTDPAHLDPVVNELTSLTTASFWATEQEVADLLDTLVRLTEPFAGRTEDPTARPDGARFMRWFSAVNPDLDVAPHSTADHPAAPQED